MTACDRSWRALTTALVIGFMGSTAAYAGVPTVKLSGSMPRGQTPTTMSLQIELNNIDPGDVGGMDEKTFVLKNVTFRLKDYPGKNEDEWRVRNDGESSAGATGTGTSGTNINFLTGYVAKVQSAQLTQITDTTAYKLTASITIDSSSDEKTFAVIMKERQEKFIRISLYYSGATSTGGQARQIGDSAYSIAQTTGVANEAPSSLTITPTFLSFDISWQSKDSIPYVGTPASGAPTGINILVFNADVGTKELPGLAYSADGNEAFSACTFNPDGGAACLTCPNNTYLDIPKLQELDYVKVYTTGPSASPFRVPGLEEDKTYMVAASYEPDGLKVSSCVTGKPTLNYTMSELNKDGKKAKQQDPRCFVATAAYGSAYHEYVATLRWFRNTYLLPYHWGRTAVAFYYRHSPPLARYIAAHEGWRTASRVALWPVVQSVKMLRVSPGLALAGMASCMASLLWLAHRRRRQWQKESQ